MSTNNMDRLKAERDFLLLWPDAYGRVAGISATQLMLCAFGVIDPMRLRRWDFPSDAGDLGRSIAAHRLLPDHLRGDGTPADLCLAQYRAHLGRVTGHEAEAYADRGVEAVQRVAKMLAEERSEDGGA